MSKDRGSARERVPTHLDLALESERYEQVRETLRSLPQLAPPAELTTRLRVAASQPSQRAPIRSRWCTCRR